MKNNLCIYIVNLEPDFMATEQKMQQEEVPKYSEFLIAKADFKPIFSWQKVKADKYSVEKEVPSITLVGKKDGKKSDIVLTGKPFGRFLRAYMKIGKRVFMAKMYKVTDVKTGNKIHRTKTYIGKTKAQTDLTKLYNKSEIQNFKILDLNGQTARITTEDYIGIPHTFVQEIIENRLKAEGITYEKSTKFDGVNGVYQFTNTDASLKTDPKVGDEIAHSISYLNRNSGSQSLKLFGGAVVLVCSNGMVSDRAQSKMRLVHKLELGEIRKKIESKLGEIIEKVNLLPQEFMRLREYKVTREEAEVLVNSLPVAEYLKKAIWTRLFEPSKKTRNGKMDWDGTMWGIYMASTFIASNVEVVKKSNRSQKAVDDRMVEKLSKLEMFSDIWDKREEVLAKSKATKLEVKV